MSKSKLEELLAIELTDRGIEYEREYRFHPTRKWRLDFAFPSLKLGVEVDGGLWTQGRHQRPDGFQKDCEKMNAAALLGWRILRFTAVTVCDGTAAKTISHAIAGNVYYATKEDG